MLKQPYIGVTGFATAAEVDFASDRIPSDSARALMVGVLASAKSLRGIPLSERWVKQFPPAGGLADLFWNDPQTLSLIHYSGDETMLADLLRLGEMLEEGLDGFQLNIAWPAPLKLETFHRLTESKAHVVLQLGRRAISNDVPFEIANRLWDYVGLVDALLLDMSGGEGRPLDLRTARQYLSAFREVGLPFALGVAGGLGPGSLESIQALLEEFPDLSWDAQGRLRNADNELDLEAVGSYLEQSFALVQK